MKTLRHHQQEFFQNLGSHYPETELYTLFFILTEHLLDLPRLKVLLEMDQPVSETVRTRFMEYTQRLLNHEPVQYILGKAPFCGLDLLVNPEVLIPRPETEELVHWILELERESVHMLDIGTGSGCIALALAARRPDFTIRGIDVSEQALLTARQNAEALNLRLNFEQSDILQIPLVAAGSLFDLIVSNPPYVMDHEQVSMAPRVTQFEPAKALFVPDEDPLLFYRAILHFSGKQLKGGGRIYFEINEKQGLHLLNLMHEFGYSGLEIRKDLHGKDRFVKGVKPY